MSWTTSIEGRRAVVTGATSGIGRGCVAGLAGAGCAVLAVGRRDAHLAELAAETGCATLAADVRETERLAGALADFAPDILVNNAGVGHGIAGLHGLDIALIREAVEINVIAPLTLAALVLERMREAGRGHVVNVGSIAGLHSMTSALYGAGKGAIHRFSQNLRFELRGTGIRVTEICPGRVTSEFYQAAAGDRGTLDRLGVTGIRELAPEDIAETVLFAVSAPEHVNVSTIEVFPTDQCLGGAVVSPRGG